MVYLDTDIVISLLENNKMDYSEYIDENSDEDLKISVFTLLEILDIMEEMNNDLNYFEFMDTIEEKGIQIEPLTKDILKIFFKLNLKYDNLSLLSKEHLLHISFSIYLDETLVSPDPAYWSVKEVTFDYIGEKTSQDDWEDYIDKDDGVIFQLENKKEDNQVNG